MALINNTTPIQAYYFLNHIKDWYLFQVWDTSASAAVARLRKDDPCWSGMVEQVKVPTKLKRKFILTPPKDKFPFTGRPITLKQSETCKTIEKWTH